MTYIDNWDDFAKAAEQLYLTNPNKVRTALLCVRTQEQGIVRN